MAVYLDTLKQTGAVTFSGGERRQGETLKFALRPAPGNIYPSRTIFFMAGLKFYPSLQVFSRRF